MTMNEEFPLALQPGTILAGQYTIEKVLGQGGFGITYSATDHTTGQRVAIKEFFPDTLAYREKTTVISYPGERSENYEYGKTGFLEEAKTLAEFIGNENIVRIYTYFEENNTAYFAMEFIEGVSFDKYLRDHGGKIPFDDAKRILVPIMDALAVVHSKGIVHRDVTPDNIYITNDNKIKLLDFGAARYSLGDKSRSLDVILKHGFAPKEQYTRRGKQGPFTDVYSLGATFYFALTGRRPPDAVDRLEEDDLIPPSSLGAQLTEYEERAILQAMQVQPSERFQNMIAFKNVMLGENAAEPVSQPEPQQPNKIVFSAPEQSAQPVDQLAQQTQQQFVQPTQQQFPQQTSQQFTQQVPEQPAQSQPGASPVSAPVAQQKKSSGKIIGIVAVAAAVIALSIAAAIIIPSLNSKVDTSKGDKDKTTTSVTTEVPEDTTTTTTTTTTVSETTTPPPETTTTTTTTTAAITTAAPAASAGDASVVFGNIVNNIGGGGSGIAAQVGSNIYKVVYDDSGYNKISEWNYKTEKWESVLLGKDHNIKIIKNLCIFENQDVMFVGDGYIYYANKGNDGYSITKLTTNYHDGEINAFYWTTDYIFVHYYNYNNGDQKGGWARISLKNDKVEQELLVIDDTQSVLLDGYFYFAGYSDSLPAIVKCSATDFDQCLGTVNLTENNSQWNVVTSDGKYIYASWYKTNDDRSREYKLCRIDQSMDVRSITEWKLGEIVSGTDYIYFSGFSVYNNHIFGLVYDNSASKYGVFDAILGNGKLENHKIKYEGAFDWSVSNSPWPVPCIIVSDDWNKAVFNVIENGKFESMSMKFSTN